MNRLIPLAAVAAAAIFVAGCGSSGDSNNSQASSPSANASSSAAANTAVDIVSGSVDEWKVRVDKKRVPAGKVTFTVTNKGKMTHEFVVLRTGKPADDLGKRPRISESGNVGEIGDIKPGATKKVTLKLEPGHYALVCNMTGHYEAGMDTDLMVA